MRTRRWWSLGGTGTVVAVLATLLPVLAATPAEAAWSQPTLARSISGSGRPGVFPWGIQYNPVSNEILVGDYLNYQVRRYGKDGRILGSFFRPNYTGQPYSIAVDPRNGDVYVPEIISTGSNKVARYDKTGGYLGELTLTGSDYIAWITIDDQGYLWQSDSHTVNGSTKNPPMIRKWRLSDGLQVDSWTPPLADRPTPRMYGIDVDAAGNVWATDTANKLIYKWSSTGALLAEYADTHLSADLRGITVDDRRGYVYVTDAAVDQIEKFSISGQWLATKGGTGSGLGGLDAPRQTTVDTDGKLYIAEYGNARYSVLEPNGLFSGYYPDPPQPAPAGQLGQPRDVDVDQTNGDVWVADSWNQRVQRFSAQGAFLGAWGSRGADNYGMNYPRGIGVDPVSRNVWVVNQRGHHIKRYDASMRYIDKLGDASKDSSAPGAFRWPLDVEFAAGRAYVSDTASGVVKVLDARTGAEISQWPQVNHGLAVDASSGDIFVTDPATNQIHVYSADGTKRRSFGGSGTAPGQFRHAWDAVVAGGVLYVTDDRLSRITAFALDGTVLGTFGGYGAGPYQFANPSGIATDRDGRLYVADAANDRVQVFDPRVARTGGSWPPPSTTVTTPEEGAELPGAPVRIAGTVTDSTGVAQVQVAVQDTASGLWFNPTQSTWQSTKVYAFAPWTGPAARTSVTYAWTWIGEDYGHNYRIEVRSTDVGGSVGPSVTRTFSVSARETQVSD
jgi:DNA-binding beta-propeller fold protein YncE